MPWQSVTLLTIVNVPVIFVVPTGFSVRPWNCISRLSIEQFLSVLSPLLSQQGDQTALHCAHQATVIHPNNPSKLACVPHLEGHPCWSMCGRRTRPFSGRAFREHRTNVGVLPIPFIVRVLQARRASGRSLLILLRPRVARAQRAVWLTCILRAFRAPPDFPNDPISFIRTLHASGVQQSHPPIPESPFLQHCSTCNRGVIHV